MKPFLIINAGYRQNILKMGHGIYLWHDFTFNCVNKISHSANTLYRSISFQVSLQSEIWIHVCMIPNEHFIPDRVFNPE